MKSPAPIYADFASSAPPLPEVVDAMMEWLGGSHANPHADHLPGHRAARAVEDARQQIADLIEADPDGVVFTSGATESNNLALKGLAGSCGEGLLFSPLDHSSIVEVARYLGQSGSCRVRQLKHDAHGSVSAGEVENALAASQGRVLVALAHGNNEIGTIQPLTEIGTAVSDRGHLLHLDASQTAAHIGISVQDMHVTTLSISGHKLYGPAGIGVLWVNPSHQADLLPIFHGGGQQAGIRSGTVPTYLAVGLGVAARLARDRMEQARTHLQAMASQFIAALTGRGLAPVVIGHPSDRLPGHLSVRFPGVAAPDLLARLLPLLAVSTGAACSAGELRASRVLRELGLDEETASEGLRISFGRTTTSKEVALAAEYMSDAVREVLDSI